MSVDLLLVCVSVNLKIHGVLERGDVKNGVLSVWSLLGEHRRCSQ